MKQFLIFATAALASNAFAITSDKLFSDHRFAARVHRIRPDEIQRATPEQDRQVPQEHAESPDHRYSVDLLDTGRVDLDGLPVRSLEVRDRDKQIASEKTFGYLLDVFWGDHYVAVSNRRGNSADFLWVFSLPDGKCIKRVDSGYQEFESRAAKAFCDLDARAKDDKRMNKEWIQAGGFVGGDELIISVTRSYSTGKLVTREGFSYYTQDEAHPVLWFRYCALYRVTPSGFQFIEGSARPVDLERDTEKPCTDFHKTEKRGCGIRRFKRIVANESENIRG